jgi:acetate kinase
MESNNRCPGHVLVINCGSSSIKYQLLLMPEGQLLAGGVVERIGEAGPILKHRELDAVSGDMRLSFFF